MTVSIWTTRLSSVITGCGGKDTTCSRRSIRGLTRSTKGTISASPGSSVRWKRPRRSTTPARACGTIRTPDAATNSTNNSTTNRAMTPPVTAHTSISNKDRSALDLDDLDALPGLEDPAVLVRAGAPLLALELDHAGLVRRRLQHQRMAPDEPRGARPQARRHAAVRPRDRAQPGQDDDRHHERGRERDGKPRPRAAQRG